MGFPWVNKSDKDGEAKSWLNLSKNIAEYFPNMCYVDIEGKEVKLDYKDLKFPNEDNWEEDNEL